MKLIKIEEVINGRPIGTINKSDDNIINTESSILSNTNGKDTKENNEATVVEVPQKTKRKDMELLPFGRKSSLIIIGLLIVLSVSIAYLCTGYDYDEWFIWNDFYRNLFITFVVSCFLYRIAIWRKSEIIKLANMFKPKFGKGYNRLLTVSFVFMPWIVSLIFYADEDPKEFLSALLIAYAIECILYISILWIYNGFEEERKENKEKVLINNKTNEL